MRKIAIWPDQVSQPVCSLRIKFLLFLMFLFISSKITAQYKTEIYVAKDGTGDFKSIQAAIDATKSFPDKRIVIYIKKGVYDEKVKVHSWNTNLTLKGESKANTIIRWNDHFKKMDRGGNSTFHTATLLVQGDNFQAENLSIENTAGDIGQAVALAVEADRCVFTNCRLIGNQDTFFANGANTRQHFIHCYVEGTTDFIFGGATVLFEDCIIHSKLNSYITAASTPKGRKYGFVFIKCNLTADESVDSVYLGRPWRSYAKTVFIECKMGEHILPKGWHNWDSKEKEKTVYYAEYRNTGPGANRSERVSWSYSLSNKEAENYAIKEVLQPFLLPEMID
jgi:pectinesterase